MWCSNCLKSNASGAKFCSYCGTKLESTILITNAEALYLWQKNAIKILNFSNEQLLKSTRQAISNAIFSTKVLTLDDKKKDDISVAIYEGTKKYLKEFSFLLNQLENSLITVDEYKDKRAEYEDSIRKYSFTIEANIKAIANETTSLLIEKISKEKNDAISEGNPNSNVVGFSATRGVLGLLIVSGISIFNTAKNYLDLSDTKKKYFVELSDKLLSQHFEKILIETETAINDITKSLIDSLSLEKII